MSDDQKSPDDSRGLVFTPLSPEEPIPFIRYVMWLTEHNADRRCHVCDHDKFSVITDTDAQCFVTRPRGAPSTPEGYPDLLSNYCKKCGTVTTTLARLVREWATNGAS